MAENGPTITIREAVGVFDDGDNLLAAAEELERAGFDRSDLSLMAGETDVDETFGRRYRRAGDLAGGPRPPRSAVVDEADRSTGFGALTGGLAYVSAAVASGAVVASGGTLAPAVAAAVAAGAGGGALGAALSKVLDDRFHQDLEDHLGRGGLLLWVDLRRTGGEDQATEILRRHGARDVDVYDIPTMPSTVS